MTYNTEFVNDHMIVTDTETPNTRYIVYPDPDVMDPLKESGYPVEYYVINSGYRSASDKPEGQFSQAFARFYETMEDFKAIETVRRYVKIFHNWTEQDANDRVVLFRHTGYSQGDWAYLFVAVVEDGYGTAEGYAEEWSMWARGDVYMMHAEYFEECDASEDCECDLDDEDHWTRINDQGIESEFYGGIYADGAEEAVKVYQES